MQRHRLTDEQWNRIKLLIPGKDGDPGRHGRNNRLFVESVLWLAKTGAPWRDLPSECGNKANRIDPIECDWATYKERHLVECFFARLKQFRRIATRYDKTAAAFLAFVSLACLMAWLR